MSTVIIFIVILGVLIFVHELGHFVVARKNGIRADEFGFGFPPRIFGLQYVYGKKREKTTEVESIYVETTDIQSGKEEIIQETITEKIYHGTKQVPVGKWRVIWGSHDGDDESEKKDLDEAVKKRYAGGTIYSLNWIPLGGFVRIKGENGENHDKDSFAAKSAWTRTKVLAAGVIMNFVLAWTLFSLAFLMGAPEQVDSSQGSFPDSKIQISEVIPGAPADSAGLKVGDEILKTQINSSGEKVTLRTIGDFQDYTNSERGKGITLALKRGGQYLEIKTVPRIDTPEGQGPLGISLAETAIVRYPFHEAVWKGLIETFRFIELIVVAIFVLIKNLIVGQPIGAEVTGPVGIAKLTGVVAGLGIVYLLQFVALLSINLGIINALPIPALDGGRILFIIIEKIRGYPVSQKVEQTFHTIFFVLLLILMVLVTMKDIFK